MAYTEREPGRGGVSGEQGDKSPVSPTKAELIARAQRMEQLLAEGDLFYGRPGRGKILVTPPVETPPLPGAFLDQVRSLAAPIHKAIDTVTRLYEEDAAVRDHLNQDISPSLRPYFTAAPPRIMRLDVIPVENRRHGSLRPKVNEFQIVSAGQGHAEEMFHVQKALGIKTEGTSLAQAYTAMLAQEGHQNVAIVCHTVSAYRRFHQAFARRCQKARPDIHVGVYGAQECQIRDGRLYVPVEDGGLVKIDAVDRHFLLFALPEGENPQAPPDRRAMTDIVKLALNGAVEVFPAPNPAVESRFFFTLFYDPRFIPTLRKEMGKETFEKTQESLIETYVFDPDHFPLRPFIRHLLSPEGQEALLDYFRFRMQRGDLFPGEQCRLDEERRREYEARTAALHPTGSENKEARRALKRRRRAIARELKAEYYAKLRGFCLRQIKDLAAVYGDLVDDYETPLPPLRLGGRPVSTWEDLLSLPPSLNPLVVKEAGFAFGSSAGRSIIMPPKNGQETADYRRRLQSLAERVRDGQTTAVVQPFVSSPRFPVSILEKDGNGVRRLNAKLRVCPFILRSKNAAPEDAQVPLIAVTAGDEGRVVHGGKLNPTFIPHSEKETVENDL